MQKRLIESREEFIKFIGRFDFANCHMSFDWPEKYPVVVMHHKSENHAYSNICAYFNYVYLSDFNSIL